MEDILGPIIIIGIIVVVISANWDAIVSFFILLLQIALLIGGVVGAAIFIPKYLEYDARLKKKAIEDARRQAEVGAEHARKQAHEAAARKYEEYAEQFQGTVRKILQLERSIIATNASLGIDSVPTAAEKCHSIISRSMNGHGTAREELVALGRSLTAEQRALQGCAQSLNEARNAFEAAKEAIFENGSSTLLADLDAIGARLHSPLIRDILRKHRWQEADEICRLFVKRLSQLKRVASQLERERAFQDTPFTANEHTTLDEAYDVLGVNGEWPRKAIETHVKALRMRFYVDHAPDEGEKLKRTRVLQQVNAAWEIIQRRRSSD